MGILPLLITRLFFCPSFITQTSKRLQNHLKIHSQPITYNYQHIYQPQCLSQLTRVLLKFTPPTLLKNPPVKSRPTPWPRNRSRTKAASPRMPTPRHPACQALPRHSTTPTHPAPKFFSRPRTAPRERSRMP